MINETTDNKNYPLPHPENIASQDVERIASAIEMIDVDVLECEKSISSVQSTVNTIDQKSLRIPDDQIGIINPELQDLSAKKYLVVNADATGFTTVEGGGGAGGKKGEVLVKNSDENFDTKWIDPRAILNHASKIQCVSEDFSLSNNSLVILDSELSESHEDLPLQGMSPRQISNDVTADSFASYVLKDEIEDAEEENDWASKTKFGRVKIGSGINVEDGLISVPSIGIASKDEFGLVKIGDGLSVSKGVVSANEILPASHDNFGTIKLSDDFTVGTDGELLLADSESNEAIIYQTSKISVCENNTLAVRENCAKYRLVISEDSVIHFDWSQIEQQNDILFDVELYSSDKYLISFDENIIWEAPCSAVVPGKTVVRFSKPMSSNCIVGTMISQDEFPEKLLTVYNNGDDIAPNYICRTTGTNGWIAGEILKHTRSDVYWEYTIPVIPNEDGAIFQIDFMRSTYVTKVEFDCTRGSATAFFFIEASLDGINWIQQYQLINQSVSGNFVFELSNRGLYRHYRIRCASGVCFSRVRFLGYDIDDRLFELRKIVPRMFADTQNGFKITSHTLVNEGSLFNITSSDIGSYASFGSRDEDGNWWIKYELPEAKVVDVIDFSTGNGNTNYNPSWFKIEASNDDENWSLLYEFRQDQPITTCKADQFFVDNSTAYKYYKLSVLETNHATGCRIYRWRLYKKEDGLRQIENFIPKILASSQDGFDISADSHHNDDHRAFYAFDQNSSTKWASSGSTPAWLQIKFPNAVCCNAFALTSRNDGSYNQAPQSFELQGSDDGKIWNTLDIESGITFAQNETKLFDFPNEMSFQYYRLYVTKNNGGSNVSISEFQLGKILKKFAINLTENK